MEPKQQRIVIIGAGPTGLGAAYRLDELKISNYHIYEKNSYAGGLSHTFRDDKGFLWDVGGHVYFSHYKYFDDMYTKVIGNRYQENNREAWVKVGETWVPYPFQNNLRYLSKTAQQECLQGLIKAQELGKAKEAKNFGEFIDYVFGEGIAKHFMRPYNFKVWAHPPELMNKEWIGERVAIIDVQRAKKNIEESSDDFGWGPNNRFKYNFLGAGQLQDEIATMVDDHISYNADIEHIDLESKTVHFKDGKSDRYDNLLTTMPLDILISKTLRGTIPEEVKTKAAQLRHSSGYIVGVGLKGKVPNTWSWMYFPGDNCPFYRVTYLSNYSPHMAKEGCYSVLCETSFSSFKQVDESKVLQQTIDGLKVNGIVGSDDEIVTSWMMKVDYCYPTPSIERDDALNVIIPWLENQGIYSRGRFGLWKYEVANTDHSMIQGVEAINMLLFNEPETTKGIKYQSTTTGREEGK